MGALPPNPRDLALSRQDSWAERRAALALSESRPLSRRSGCVSAEPYPPLRSVQSTRDTRSKKIAVYTKDLTRPIYRAVSRENAEQQLEVFAAKWDPKYRTISQLWRRHWEQIVHFFAFPADIRKVIYTTNAVESLNMTLRKVIKTRGSFPNEDAAIRLLYLALMNVAKKWHTLQGWPQALNHFAILWGDRFPERPR